MSRPPKVPDARKQDWSTRPGAVERALSHWPRLRKLVKSYHYDARPALDGIFVEPPASERAVKLHLDDILYLVEGDCEHDPLCFQDNELWKEARAALLEFPGEKL